MKKLKILILSVSILTLLIPIGIYADEEPVQQTESLTYGYGDTSELSDNFWNNYILLPYIESSGSEYIDTGYKANSELEVDLYCSNVVLNESAKYLYGSNGNVNDRFYTAVLNDGSDKVRLAFGSGAQTYSYNLNLYSIYNLNQIKNELYINDVLTHTLTYSSFNSNQNIYIFSCHDGNIANGLSSYRLYYFSIYDHTELNDEEVGLVRSYYPARSKSGSIVGLYDAVGDVFYPSSGSAFSLPQGSDFELSLSARILAFITSSLSWSGSILAFAAANPMILFFMAIGLAGAAFRWARRLVHF